MKRNFRCIIVDDEPNAIDLLKSRLKLLFPEADVVNSFVKWDEALPALRTNDIDILFLDVSMPEKSGMDFLKLLPDYPFQVVFITAHSEFALQAIKLSAAGYVLKPIDDYELTFAISKALTNLANKSNGKTDNNNNNKLKIGIPNAKGVDYLNAEDILYFESVNKYTKVVTNEYSIMSSYNLGEFKKILNANTFFQAHRSYIVNLYKVKRYETSGLLVMDDNMQIPVSKSIRNEFIDEFGRISRTAGLKSKD